MSRMVSIIDELAVEAAGLFHAIGEATSDVVGVTRDAFGSKETLAGEMLRDFARAHGIAASYDGVGNLNLRLADDRAHQQEILIGSHLDSVPRGGNYDGLAGVIAGILVLIAVKRHHIETQHAIRVVGFRGEESPWFGTAYLGSRLFVGDLSRSQAESLTRYDTGRTLLQHLEDLGLDVTVDPSRSQIDLQRVRAYLELHIEQAPLLEALDRPVAIANAIRGNIRHPRAICSGAYAHSGAVPRHLRSDAALATAKLLAHADDEWQDLIGKGNEDLVFTCGILHTDRELNTMTKVPGEVTFSLNIGGTSDATMELLHESLVRRAEELSTEHRVRFDFGECVGTPAVALDSSVLRCAVEASKALSIPVHIMPTVGHDAAVFARRGIASSVILVRNANGSHNPAESLEMADFILGVKLLAATALAL